MALRMAATASSPRSWFFAEKASIEGATRQSRSSSSPSHTNARREKT
jgi:hypothetical protein